MRLLGTSVGEAAVLVLLGIVTLASCHPATRFGEPSPTPSFRGYAACGFEASHFLPCGTKVPYWLDCSKPSMAQVLDVMAACEVQPCSTAGVYLEFAGDLSPKGHYGHFGMYQREITPKRVSYVNGVGPDNCGWSLQQDWQFSM